MEVLVTGGTGFLGKVLVPMLAASHEVRVMTRRNRPDLPLNVSAIRGDLITGEGVRAAMGDAEVVIHAATNAVRRTKATDVGGMQRLIDEARNREDPPHIVFPSIVGIDDHPLPYYRAKLQAEQSLSGSGLPFSILRGTQFHVLMAFAFDRLLKLPIAPVVRGWLVQPVDESEFAGALSDLVGGSPRGRVGDFGGPQVLSTAEMATEYLNRKGRPARIIGLPPVGGILKAYASGANVDMDAAKGTVTWSEWLVENR